jgi:hypothetical protein
VLLSCKRRCCRAAQTHQHAWFSESNRSRLDEKIPTIHAADGYAPCRGTWPVQASRAESAFVVVNVWVLSGPRIADPPAELCVRSDQPTVSRGVSMWGGRFCDAGVSPHFSLAEGAVQSGRPKPKVWWHLPFQPGSRSACPRRSLIPLGSSLSRASTLNHHPPRHESTTLPHPTPTARPCRSSEPPWDHTAGHPLLLDQYRHRACGKTRPGTWPTSWHRATSPSPL